MDNHGPSLYPYNPSKALPIVFAVIVFAITSSIIYQSLRYGWKHFCAVITFASSAWITGFIVREISAYNPSPSKQVNINLFITQYVMIFVGPPLYAASEYFILGRLLAYVPYHTPLHPGRVMVLFVFLSAAVECLAANGASASATAKTASARNSAIARIKASLILQEVVEACFFSLVALVEYRCRKAKRFPRNVRTMCYVLYITSLMMIVRCVVRTIEGFESTQCEGYCGPVQKNEWFLWVFEVANITVFLGALAVFHPRRYLPSDPKIYLDPVDGETERLGPGFKGADKRPVLVTVLDPFNLQFLFKGKDAGIEKFWEQDYPIAETRFAAGGAKRKAAIAADGEHTVPEMRLEVPMVSRT